MNILGIIPARGGSKGIPHKNLAMCAGKPLVCWTLDAVQESKLINYAVLSSDDEEILAMSGERWGPNRLHYKVLAQRRPGALAEDWTPTEAVISYVLDGLEPVPDIIVLLQPTSPVRTGRQIDEAIQFLINGTYDSVLSVVPAHVFIWLGDITNPVPYYDYKFRKRRQELPSQYEENGSIYGFTRALWDAHHNRLGGKMGLYVMPPECGPQVDTPYDLWLCEEILERYCSG